MPLKSHLHLLYLATSFWTWFFLGGLWSDYYQTWPFIQTFIIVYIAPSVFMVVIAKGMLRSITKKNYFKASIIAACYLGFTLLAYDIIYLVLFLHKDISFLWDYWYLTFFTPIPFIVLLPLGRKLDQIHPH